MVLSRMEILKINGELTNGSILLKDILQLVVIPKLIISIEDGLELLIA